MARRSDHSREELREMILSTGASLIEQGGLSKFSARAVAREIGYSIGTIYNVFKTHEEFIYTLNAKTLEEIKAQIEKVLQKEKCGDTALTAIALSYFKFAKENYNAWSAIFEHNPPEGTEPPREYLQAIEDIFTLVEKALSPICTPKKLHDTARTLWASIHGICQLKLSGKLNHTHTGEMSDILTSFIQTYLAGLKLEQQAKTQEGKPHA